MTKSQIQHGAELSVHVGPGRPGKGQRLLRTSSPQSSRRNGEKITFSVTTEEKKDIESAMKELNAAQDVSYADFFLGLISRQRQSLIEVSSPANIAATNERISIVSESIGELSSRLESVAQSVNTVSGLTANSKTQLATKIDKSSKDITSLISDLSSVATAQANLAHLMEAIILSTRETTLTMTHLAAQVKALSQRRPPEHQTVMPPSTALHRKPLVAPSAQPSNRNPTGKGH